ncbi:Histidine kinase [Saccharicrinis carchari]|uniref:Histidine kinase n=1 Tax=Saccharicrinis carchari TaxID=1168039 RepID=A0A521BG37_SACCC|nr:histidine kinase [Saccharicrinis carchari]SMO46074.1 Histidine kinase [Saccharicrinis carchari]
MQRKPILLIHFKKRLGLEVLMGTLFYFVLSTTFYKEVPYRWQGYLLSVLIFFLLSEGTFSFNKLIAKKYPWHTHTLRRIIMLVSFTAIWFTGIGFFSHLVKPAVEQNLIIPPSMYNASVVMTLLFVTIYIILLFAYNYHQSLSEALLENERLKQEKITQDYQSLQDQLNPHFLFNNLNTLMAIIRHDKDAAIRFTSNFSDVYRYVLQSNKRNSVSLKEELRFIESYWALHKERLGEGLIVEADIDKRLLDWHLPPLSLQLLVENAVKHNVATKLSPLTIRVYTKNNKLVVSNNLNVKNTTYSTKTGCENLKKRYAFLTDEKVVIDKRENEFKVQLPLIEQ